MVSLYKLYFLSSYFLLNQIKKVFHPSTLLPPTKHKRGKPKSLLFSHFSISQPIGPEISEKFYINV